VTDPASGVGVLAALAAGTVSLHVTVRAAARARLPSAVAGVAPADLEHAGARRVLPPSLAFVASFSLIFILLGLGATSVGSALRSQQEMLDKVAAGLIIAMGAFFVGSAFVTRLNRRWHVEALRHWAGQGRPNRRRRCLRGRLDTLRRPDPRCDPQRRRADRVRRPRRALARLLLRRPRDPIPRHGPRLQRMTTAFAVVERHFPVIIGIGGAVLIVMGALIWTGELFQLNIKAQHLLDSLGPSSTTSEPATRRRRTSAAVAFCLQRRNLRRTLRIALVVGVVLTAINQGSVIAGGDATVATRSSRPASGRMARAACARRLRKCTKDPLPGYGPLPVTQHDDSRLLA
jgi:cytochrome c-type biogenesis protein